MQFNRQGREVSDSMRLKYFSDWERSHKPQHEFTRTNYRGFTIMGIVGKGLYVQGEGRIWQIGFTTEAKAKEAVDRCLALRSELGE